MFNCLPVNTVVSRKAIIGFLMVILTAITWSCNNAEVTDGELITDQDPAITLITPTNGVFLGRVGTNFQATLQAADNEALKLIRIMAQVYNDQDAPVGSATILQDFQVSGKNVTQPVVITVPSLPAFYRVKYTCFVIDLKGASASTFFNLNVLPEAQSPSNFKLLTYNSDTIFNKLSTKKYAFNFTNRVNLPKAGGQTNVLDFDIEENSGTGRGAWIPTIGSPSNNQLGLDSVFVKTDLSRFNYDAATYETIYNAFYSDPSPSTLVADLDTAQIIIVRLIKTPRPQFAVMKILGLKNDGGGLNVKDYVTFDYKVTTPQ